MKTQFNLQFNQLRVAQEALIEAQKEIEKLRAHVQDLQGANERQEQQLEKGDEENARLNLRIRDLETANGYAQRKCNEVVLQRRQIRLALKLAQNILRDE